MSHQPGVLRGACLPIPHNRDDNLASTGRVARDMSRKLVYILNKLRLQTGSCGSAHAFPKGDGLACDVTLERAQYQLLRVRGVDDVEATPIDSGGRRRKG